MEDQVVQYLAPLHCTISLISFGGIYFELNGWFFLIKFIEDNLFNE